MLHVEHRVLTHLLCEQHMLRSLEEGDGTGAAQCVRTICCSYRDDLVTDIEDASSPPGASLPEIPSFCTSLRARSALRSSCASRVSKSNAEPARTTLPLLANASAAIAATGATATGAAAGAGAGAVRRRGTAPLEGIEEGGLR